MADRPPLPEELWERVREALEEAREAYRAGRWNGAGKIVIELSSQGVPTSIEFTRRHENRRIVVKQEQ